MLDQLLLVFTNLIYLVPFKVKQFKAREPNARILAAGATKARRLNQDSAVQREAGWITAKRDTLILTDHKLVCGSWEIPISTINHAVLVRFQGIFSQGLVLKVATMDGHHYQFGLQYDSAWVKQRALPLTIENSQLQYSKFSLIFRVILVIWLVILLIQWFS